MTPEAPREPAPEPPQATLKPRSATRQPSDASADGGDDRPTSQPARRRERASWRERSPRSFAGRAYAGLASLGVVVGAIAATIALFGDVTKLFKGEPPTVIDARIERVVQTRARMPFGDYLREVRLPSSSFNSAELAQHGYEFNVTVTISGRIGKELPLRWKMFRRPETPLPGPIYDREAVGFEPAGTTHSDSWPVWVPYPPDSGTYYIRFTLQDERGLPASQLDSTDISFPPRN